MVLKPLSDFLGASISMEQLFQEVQEAIDISDPDTYSRLQEEMLREALNKQAETHLTGICADEGFKLISVEVIANADYTAVQELYITVKQIRAGSRPFIYIEPPVSDESLGIKNLKNTLSEVYNMSLDNIHITESE